MFELEDEEKYLKILAGSPKYDRDAKPITIPDHLLFNKNFLIKAIKQKHYQNASILDLLIRSKSVFLFNPEILAYLVVYENFRHGGIHYYLNSGITCNGIYNESYLVWRLAVSVTQTKEYEDFLEKIKLEYENENAPTGAKDAVDLFTLDDI